MNVLSILFTVIVGLIAIIIVFVDLWRRDPIRSALAGLLASLVVMAGSLRAQSWEWNATVPDVEILGVPIKDIDISVVTSSDVTWQIAFVSIALALAWFGYLLVWDRRHEREHKTNNDS